MLEFETLEGPTFYIDPVEIMMVAPALAEPNPSIPNHLQIPNVLGAQVVLRNGFKIGVKGMAKDVAAKVAKGKAAGRPTLQ